MTDFPIQARAADHVAVFLADTDGRPDIVLSVGHDLPPAAGPLVQPLHGPDSGKSRHLDFRPDGLTISEDRVGAAILPLLALDEQWERELGRPPRILLHCGKGETRSVNLALALYAGRMLRDEPQQSLVKLFDTLGDRIEDSLDEPQDGRKMVYDEVAYTAKSQMVAYLGSALAKYQRQLMERAPAAGPSRPAASAAAAARPTLR